MRALDGILVMRRSILIRATPERIWQEFESEERMSCWFGGAEPTFQQRVTRYEPGTGGWFEIEAEWTHDKPGSCRLGGKIVAYDPPREMTVEWNSFHPVYDWSEPTLVTIRLTPALGGTLVEILQHGFERVGEGGVKYHRDAEGGWNLLELDALRRIVEGA
ncbi:MAG TPA: SRPBCC domain-containing protein [Dehalococcoidia bacterium]